MVRLYVGGLAEDITAEQLSQRFQGFGRVGDCEVVAPKANDTFRLPTASCRGFGYVDLDLPDEAALRKIVSVYNGSKWRGQVLNVQLAKPSYSAKLKEEWELEKAVPVEDDREASGNPGTDELTLIASNNTVVTTAANKRKTTFPDVPPAPASLASWEGLPPTAAQLRKRAFEEAMAPAFEAAEAARRRTKKRQKKLAKPAASSEELAAVDFMDGEVTLKPRLDLSRFSDSDAEDERAPHEEDAMAASDGDPAEAEALWEQQGGIDQYLAALGQEHAPQDDGDTAASPSETADSAPSDPRWNAATPEAEGLGDSSSMPGDSGTSSGSKLSGPAQQDPGSGPLDSNPGQQISEPEHSEGASASEADSSVHEDEEEEGLSGQEEAADSPPASEDAGAGDTEVRETDSSDEGEASGQSDEMLTELEPDLADLFPELEAGREFWSGGAEAKDSEQRWRASRKTLATEWKNARRDAIRREQAANRRGHNKR